MTADSLLTEVLDAHGGVERWAQVRGITAHVQVRGLIPTMLWPGRPLDDYHYVHRVDVTRFSSVLSGFPRPDLTATFAPDQVEVRAGSAVVASRPDPRRAFSRVGALRRAVRWDGVDAAYFAGYAMTNYLCHPFLLAQDGFELRRGADLRRDGQLWRRLEVRHPPGFPSHCRDETFYVDQDGRIRRHDYLPEVMLPARPPPRSTLGRIGATNLTLRHRWFDGLLFPTFRRVMLSRPGGRPVPGLTLIGVQMGDISVETA